MKTSRGGRRIGSGRKPTGRSNRKTLFLSDAAIEILEGVENASVFVDQAILSHSSSRKSLQIEIELAEREIHRTAEEEINRISETLLKN